MVNQLIGILISRTGQPGPESRYDECSLGRI